MTAQIDLPIDFAVDEINVSISELFKDLKDKKSSSPAISSFRNQLKLIIAGKFFQDPALPVSSKSIIEIQKLIAKLREVRRQLEWQKRHQLNEEFIKAQQAELEEFIEECEQALHILRERLDNYYKEFKKQSEAAIAATNDQSTRDQLKKEIEDLQGEIDSNNKKMDELDLKIAKDNEKIKEFDEKIKEFDEKIKEFDGKINRLDAKIQEDIQESAINLNKELISVGIESCSSEEIKKAFQEIHKEEKNNNTSENLNQEQYKEYLLDKTVSKLFEGKGESYYQQKQAKEKIGNLDFINDSVERNETAIQRNETAIQRNETVIRRNETVVERDESEKERLAINDDNIRLREILEEKSVKLAAMEKEAGLYNDDDPNNQPPSPPPGSGGQPASERQQNSPPEGQPHQPEVQGTNTVEKEHRTPGLGMSATASISGLSQPSLFQSMLARFPNPPSDASSKAKDEYKAIEPSAASLNDQDLSTPVGSRSNTPTNINNDDYIALVDGQFDIIKDGYADAVKAGYQPEEILSSESVKGLLLSMAEGVPPEVFAQSIEKFKENNSEIYEKVIEPALLQSKVLSDIAGVASAPNITPAASAELKDGEEKEDRSNVVPKRKVMSLPRRGSSLVNLEEIKSVPTTTIGGMITESMIANNDGEKPVMIDSAQHIENISPEKIGVEIQNSTSKRTIRSLPKRGSSSVAGAIPPVVEETVPNQTPISVNSQPMIRPPYPTTLPPDLPSADPTSSQSISPQSQGFIGGASAVPFVPPMSPEPEDSDVAKSSSNTSPTPAAASQPKPADATKPAGGDKKVELAASIATLSRAGKIFGCQATDKDGMATELKGKFTRAFNDVNSSLESTTPEVAADIQNRIKSSIRVPKGIDFNDEASVEKAKEETLNAMFDLEPGEKVEDKLKQMGVDQSKAAALDKQLGSFVKMRLACGMNKEGEIDDSKKLAGYLDNLERIKKREEEFGDLLKKEASTPKFNEKTNIEELNKAVKEGKAKEVNKGLYLQMGADGKPFYSITDFSDENIDKVIEGFSDDDEIIWHNIPKEHRENIRAKCLAAGKIATFDDEPVNRIKFGSLYDNKKVPKPDMLTTTMPKRPLRSLLVAA